MRAAFLSSCALLAGLSLGVLADAPSAAPKPDAVWTAPELADYDVRSIAFLPAASYEHHLESERAVEAAIGQAFKTSGHRWVSTLVARQWLLREGGDSLLKAVHEQILKLGRVDSLQAGQLSRVTRARALLTVRVERMERLELEYNQAGKPSTSVALQAALTDSTGRLLWSARGSETMEGPYQEPATGALGVRAGGLNNQLVTGGTGAPSYAEVLSRLLTRWSPRFPSRLQTPVAN